MPKTVSDFLRERVLGDLEETLKLDEQVQEDKKASYFAATVLYFRRYLKQEGKDPNLMPGSVRKTKEGD